MSYCLASCLSFWIHQHTDTSPSPNNKTTNRNWVHNLPIDFNWGQFWNSPSDLLAKWWRMQDKRCCLYQHLWYQSAPLETRPWFSHVYKYTDKGTARGEMLILTPRVHKVSENNVDLQKEMQGQQGGNFQFCVHLCCIYFSINPSIEVSDTCYESNKSYVLLRWCFQASMKMSRWIKYKPKLSNCVHSPL